MIFLTTFFNFWRYKMKKTMIAMAVAGVIAAPIASAEVSISGSVEQEFYDDSGADGWEAATFNMLNFSASEDLGNGMTAFAKYNFLTKNGKTANDTDTHDGTTAAAETGGDNVVGLSGDFGTFVVGTMEDFTEGKAMSRMTMSGNKASIEPTDITGRTTQGMAYVSPAFSGVTFGVAGYAAGDAGSSNLDAVDLMAHYVNGPLDIIATREVTNKDATSGTEGDQEATVIGASYTMGDLKVGILNVDINNEDGTEANDNTDVAMRLDYVIGNNKITVGTLDDESTTGGVGTDVDTIEVTHKLSSRTNMYIGNASRASTDNYTYVGLHHDF